MRNYPNQPPRKVAQDLWEISGGWSNKLGRRMTVIRQVDGSLLVHNALELSPSEMDQRVSKIVAPNTFHPCGLDALALSGGTT